VNIKLKLFTEIMKETGKISKVLPALSFVMTNKKNLSSERLNKTLPPIIWKGPYPKKNYLFCSVSTRLM
jgi:hypothetical protein